MGLMMRYLLILFLALLTGCTASPLLEPREDLQAVFRDFGVKEGTFVLFDVQGNRMQLVNAGRAGYPFPPASTYKVPHSVIALETGAVRDEHEIIPYGGKPQPFNFWEQDLPMTEAIRLSSVPVYQNIARRIGHERMQLWLDKLGYGNRKIGERIDRFWLEGPLEISAIEQAKFLARLAQKTLPASQESQATVARIIRQDDWEGMELYGKTGWAMDRKPQIGWWVGWVVKGGRIYTFALNIDIHDKRDADKRLPIAKALLTRLLP